MTERSYEAFGIAVNGHIFEGFVRGEDYQPLNQYQFQIDVEKHPYLKKHKQLIHLAHILVNLNAPVEFEQ